ncbi:LysR family transcriptional regulator [Pseudooceanicola sp. C21-150M6]|uniref:LysR family transcriptional regulator n=1 Tax=Pseudooceanicola sp. C21-150M6 TaxID=3434355 RepID=UPI003D7F5307
MKRSDLPSLDDLRAFEAIVRKGSVRAAAEELALTHGAVSRRAGNLSAAVGLPLLRPDGRGVAPTEEGQALSDAMTQAMAILSSTLADLRRATGPRPLVLSCERSIAMRWLIPRLSRFEMDRPDIALHLSVGGGANDLGAPGLSLALRRLDFPVDPSWHVTRLCAERTGPVTHPDLAATVMQGGFVALASRSRPDAWSTWQQANPQAPRPGMTRLFDHHFLMVEAAAAGLGVAIAPELVVADDLARGRLMAPCGFTADGSDYGLICPEPQPGPETSLLIDWLCSEVSVNGG